jgi:hypothetical protein
MTVNKQRDYSQALFYQQRIKVWIKFVAMLFCLLII